MATVSHGAAIEGAASARQSAKIYAFAPANKTMRPDRRRAESVDQSLGSFESVGDADDRLPLRYSAAIVVLSSAFLWTLIITGVSHLL
jgi:hypothetical protein